MFISVKNRIAKIQSDVQYVREAIESKDNHPADVYNAYMERMKKSLAQQIENLRRVSSNEKQIEKLEKMVADVFA